VLLARVQVLAQEPALVLEQVLIQQLAQEPALVLAQELVLTLLADNRSTIVMSAACRHNSKVFWQAIIREGCSGNGAAFLLYRRAPNFLDFPR
jgi:hypothetical protein